MKNTKKRGNIRFIIFKEEDSDYCAVCLDFNLIEWGKDKDKLQKSIEEAAESYLKGVIENNLPDDLLNNHAPAEYWDLLKKRTSVKQNNSQTNTRMSLSQFFRLESNPYNGSLIGC